VAATAATARTIDLTPEWNASNHQRVFLGDGGDLLWISADDATNLGTSSQQWQWLDFSSTLNRIRPSDLLSTATLRWFGNVENDQSDGTTVWSIFPVPDDGARARIAILDDGVLDPSDVVKYYARHANMAMGRVTTRQIAASSPDNPVSWDVTPLVRAWHTGDVTSTVGQMLVLNDRNAQFGPDDFGRSAGEDWINWGQLSGFLGGTGPTLLVEVDSGTELPAGPLTSQSQLRAGDADQDFDFDQLDLVRVQIAAKYLTGRSATWGEGDWNGAPGGGRGQPPTGDGLFNQRDIVAALSAGIYLTGRYASLQERQTSGFIAPGDAQVIDPGAGETLLGEVDRIYVAPVPEPPGWCLAGIGLVGLFVLFARSHRQGLSLSFLLRWPT
jgi:hypothetical protein